MTAAIDFARAHGATTLEAYPVDATAGRVPAANAFHGTLAMFERAGFTVVERRQWNPTTPVRPIVRLELAPAPDEAVRVPSLTAGSTLLRHPSRPWHRRPSGLTRLSPRR